MNSYKIPKKRLVTYLIVSVIVLIIAAFISGYCIGNRLGYEQGLNQNDVVLTTVLGNVIENRGKIMEMLSGEDSKYVAYGEVVEVNDETIILMNFFGNRREVLRTDQVNNFSEIAKGDHLFVIGDPLEGDILEARFYKQITGSTILGR